MSDEDFLAERFEQNRDHLRAVAYRMLGSLPEAEDAVQESWLRLSRVDADEIDNLGGWLTTVVGRVCLDMLRSRRTRSEQPLDVRPNDPASTSDGIDPEYEAELVDSVGLAMLVVLEKLTPAERLAFVLHDMFAVPFDDIAQHDRPYTRRRSPAGQPRASPRAGIGSRAGHTVAPPARDRRCLHLRCARRRLRGARRGPGPRCRAAGRHGPWAAGARARGAQRRQRCDLVPYAGSREHSRARRWWRRHGWDRGRTRHLGASSRPSSTAGSRRSTSRRTPSAPPRWS